MTKGTGFTACVLAGGSSRRFDQPGGKLLATLAGKPLLSHAIEHVRAAGAERVILVLGGVHSGAIERALGGVAELVRQKSPLGTGDAVLALEGRVDGPFVVVNGDVPGVSPTTIREVSERLEEGASGVVVTARMPEPAGYGRVLRDGKYVRKIVEEREADEATRTVAEINSGIYGFCAPGVFELLRRVEPSPGTGEYYLTKVVELAYGEGYPFEAYEAGNWREIIGVNSPDELKQAEEVLRDINEERAPARTDRRAADGA